MNIFFLRIYLRLPRFWVGEEFFEEHGMMKAVNLKYVLKNLIQRHRKTAQNDSFSKQFT